LIAVVDYDSLFRHQENVINFNIFCLVLFGATTFIEPRPPCFDVSISRTIRQTDTLGRNPRSERSAAAQAAYCKQHNKHEAQTSMSSAGFEPATKRPQAYRTATGIGILTIYTKPNFYRFVFTVYVIIFL
jgi:hypothetical protein